MKHISVVTPCYNEEGNVRELYRRVKQVFSSLEGYTYEHIFIDNASRDRTVAILKEIATEDPSVKILVNARNFGHVRSPYHAMLQATGDAVITIVADLQDPPEMIVEFLRRWEEGYKVVIGIKDSAEESGWMFAVRSLYYCIVSRLSDTELYRNFTGFGLYDRRVVEVARQMDDPYPYFRGQIAEIGFESYRIPYRQPNRKFGITKNNFYRLYDVAMLGIVNHSKVPLRLATFLGFAMSLLSLFAALSYLVAKLVFWDWLQAGVAPMLISLFFFSSVQLFFIGIIGEYIGAILTQVQKRPLVVERERVNFGPPGGNGLEGKAPAKGQVPVGAHLCV
jgi:glycosyltransferase involved in cell wall biosynthesis